MRTLCGGLLVVVLGCRSPGDLHYEPRLGHRPIGLIETWTKASYEDLESIFGRKPKGEPMKYTVEQELPPSIGEGFPEKYRTIIESCRTPTDAFQRAWLETAGSGRGSVLIREGNREVARLPYRQ